MLQSIRKAYGAGWRSGVAKHRIMIIGGSHGVKQIIAPLNPYDNPFAPRLRPLLALVWEAGRIEGMTSILVAKKGF